MTQSLKLTCGSETIWLSEAGINLSSQFIPSPPDPGANGIADSAEVVFAAATSQSRVMFNQVNRMFELARHYTRTRVGDAVYLEFKHDVDSDDFYRSELQDGKIQLASASAKSISTPNVIEAILIFQHVPYWEGAQVPIPIMDLQALNLMALTRNFYLTTSSYNFTLLGGPLHLLSSPGLIGKNIQLGDILYITGAVNAANNGAHAVINFSPLSGVVTFSTAVVNENGGSTISVSMTPVTIDGINVYNPCVAYTSSTMAFTNPPNKRIACDDPPLPKNFGVFHIGDTIIVKGTTLNDGVYHVTDDSNTDYIVVAEATASEHPLTPVTITSQAKNWVQIPEDFTEGDLPAPIKLLMTNEYDGASLTWDAFICQNIFSTPTSMNHILECEDADVIGTPTDYNLASGGAYDLVSVPSAETKLLDWTLTGAQLDMMKGNYFRILMRLAQPLGHTDLWLKIKILHGTTLMYETEYQNVPNLSLFELATIPLPPYATLPQTADLKLQIYGKHVTAAYDVWFDYIQLSTMDGWRNLVATAGIAYTERLEDNEIDGLIFVDNGAWANKRYQFYTSSSPLLIIPGMAQRLYFLLRTGTADNTYSHLVRETKVQIYYRPRRSTI
jgi:hypothetical protein